MNTLPPVSRQTPSVSRVRNVLIHVDKRRWSIVWCQLISLLLTFALLLQLVPRVATAARPQLSKSSLERQASEKKANKFPLDLKAVAEGAGNEPIPTTSGSGDGSTFGGIIGLDSVTMSASGAYVDSFDSLIGYSASHGSQANLSSNGQIDLKGAKVYGNVLSSQANVILESGSLVSGNALYATTLTNSGTVQGTITKQTSSLITAS